MTTPSPSESIHFQSRVSVILRHGQRLLLATFGAPEARKHVFLGGHLEIGETFLECAVREMQEELGVAVQAKRLCYVMENFFLLYSKPAHELAFYVLADFERAEDAESGFPNAEEGLALEYVHCGDLPNISLLPLRIRDELARDFSSLDVCPIQHFCSSPEEINVTREMSRALSSSRDPKDESRT